MTRKNPREVHAGLIAWREYDRSLSPLEILAQVKRYENEGLEYVSERNSDTVLMFCSNEGLSFPEWRLRAMSLKWQRSPMRHAQLRAQASGMLEDMGRNRGFVSFSERMRGEVRRAQAGAA